MIDRLLVAVFTLIISAFLLMQLMMLGMPYFRKLEYDRICHTYVMTMEQQGGLNEQQQQNFINRLTERGYTAKTFSVSTPEERDEQLSFSADVAWSGWSVISLFRLTPEAFTFSYHTVLPNRHLPAPENAG